MKRVVNYSKVAPGDTFLRRYLDFNSQTESAYAYDFWCGLWLLSLAMGRECFVDRPKAPVFFNLYVILCAESGTTRKSSAVSVANRVAHAFNRVLPSERNYWLVENKCTSEHMLQKMSNLSLEHEAARVGITVSELVTFLGREKYSLTMPGTLTDLYDCPTERFGGGTVSRGSYFLRNVFVSFLAASTPSWLIRAINPDVIEGGFTSRCMFVVAEKRKAKIAWPTEGPVHGHGRYGVTELADELACIRLRAISVGGIGINETAKRLFTRWYSTRPEHRDAFQSSFESREDAHILKVAGLLAANDGTYVIQAGHLKHAIQIISEIKVFGAAMFEGAGSRSKTIIAIDTIRDALLTSASDPISRTRLHAKARKLVDSETFATIMELLVELEFVQQFEIKTGGAGRPTILYRATKGLTGAGVMEAVTERLVG